MNTGDFGLGCLNPTSAVIDVCVSAVYRGLHVAALRRFLHTLAEVKHKRLGSGKIIENDL